MNPSLCTVVILHQPFVMNETDTYQQLLQSYFGQGKVYNVNKKKIK